MTRILIVEDEGIVAMELESRLSSLGYSVCAQAVSGEEAIAQTKLHTPDLILMDIHIRGGIDGITTAEMIKEQFDIPIIFLTAFNDPQTINRAKVIEPYGYIIKPFEERELHTNIEIALYKHTMEKKLRLSEKRFSVILRNIGDAVIAADSNGIINYINGIAEELTSFSEENALGKNLLDVFLIADKEQRRQASEAISRSNNAGNPVNFPYQVTINCNGNSQKIVEVNFNQIKDEKNYSDGMVLTFRDITEKFKAEIDILESERKYRKVVESATDIIFIINTSGEFIYTNSAAVKISGYDEPELKKIGYYNFIFLSHRSEIKEKLLNQYQSLEKNQTLEFPFRTKSGEVKWLEQNSNVIFEDDKASGFHIFARDITEKKTAEFELNTRNQFIESVLENIQIGICVNSIKDKKYVYINKKFTDILGFDLEDLNSENNFFSFGTFDTDFSKDLKSKIFSNIIEGNSSQLRWETVKINTRSGEEKFVSLSIIPLIEQDILISAFQDITFKVLAEEKILQLSRAVEQSPVSIIIASKEGKIEYVNPAFTSLTGFTLEDVLGKNPRILRFGEVKKEQYKILWKTIKSGKDWQGEFQSVKKNGEVFWQVTTISSVRNTEGKITHFLGIMEDITGRKRFENELILAKEKAVESNKLKSNFLANMSHELRTPMIGILGYSDMLAEDCRSAEQREMIEVLKSSSNRLMHTLDLILDLTKIETNQADITLKEINIGAVIERELDTYRNGVENKGLYLKTFIKDKNVNSRLDEKMFSQIFHNLISNAIKFTPSGGITIEVDSEKENNNLWAVIKIIDTGIGIPQNSLSVIFEDFRQVSEGYGRSHEGVGLGLTIAKKSVELMNGEIKVKSSLGSGSTFIIRFPVELNCACGNTNEPDHEITQEHNAGSENKDKILIVDNDKMTRDFTYFILRKHYNLALAESAKSAIELAAENKFSVILMDIGLGYGMNGIEATKEIRKIKGYETTPIIAMTAYAMKGDKELFLSNGLTHYLAKPFKKDNLLNLIEKILVKN